MMNMALTRFTIKPAYVEIIDLSLADDIDTAEHRRASGLIDMILDNKCAKVKKDTFRRFVQSVSLDNYFTAEELKEIKGSL